MPATTTISSGVLNLTGSLGNSAVAISGGTLTGSGDGSSTGVIGAGVTLTSGAIDFSKNGLTTTTNLGMASLALNGGSLTFNLNGSGTDLINLGSDALSGTGAIVNINGLVGASTNGTYNLIAYGSESGMSVGGGGNLTIGTTPAALATYRST